MQCSTWWHNIPYSRGAAEKSGIREGGREAFGRQPCLPAGEHDMNLLANEGRWTITVLDTRDTGKPSMKRDSRVQAEQTGERKHSYCRACGRLLEVSLFRAFANSLER